MTTVVLIPICVREPGGYYGGPSGYYRRPLGDPRDGALITEPGVRAYPNPKDTDMKLEIECKACSGSGIYHGMAEPPGVGVVCIRCDGTGRQVLEYTPFTGRKPRTDIQTVQLSRGSFILTCGPAGSSIRYEQFMVGERPQA